ncbi:AAA-like domain-containing protein [Desmonostoc muscorum LEGE 12446]|uniref:AAA-like domain-containing protein n=1 Tax=Desmonostoc muscorum LEGE 12446 TaxID=1828758 RepID=A0A8J7CZ02_DESMC|nr:AAA-like domain-containing protein [Desmonostoc muscorum]MCF2149782.1 AAA-like domain-containing protein [Desmonostoc muscorum LEGE 12446]
MNVDTLCESLNRELTAKQSRPLNPAETFVLRGIWQCQTYSQIAENVGYSSGYLTNVVAPELLHRLSDLIGQRLTKKNCRILLEKYATSYTNPQLQKQSPQPIAVSDNNPNQAFTPAFPSGAIAVDSPFYIPRPPIESQVCAEICKPGALVRIKAPRETGKTSLLLRVLDYAQRQGYRSVYLNLDQMDRAVCADLNRFLRSLCASVARQLQLEPKLDEYWDEDIGSKVSCTLYFRQHLLEQIQTPVVFALDELNQIFEYPSVAKDFLPLLRSWYEEAKRIPIWQNLRLIIAHSTEVYVPLQMNLSPFNVGLSTQLMGFTVDQVQQLAQRYGLNWSDGKSAAQLMALVGGHPALLHTTIYYLSRETQPLRQLLAMAFSPTGIYYHHLQGHWATLQQQPALLRAFHTVLSATEPVYLESSLAHQLNSMGMINLLENRVTVRCELYRQYFQTKMSLER